MRWIPLLIPLCALPACPGGGGDGEPTPAAPSPPTAPAVSIGPERPTTEDALVLRFTTDSTDPDGDLAGYRIRWTRDGAAVDARDDADEVPASETARGQTWRVAVAAVDAGGRWSAEATASRTVVNAPPSFTELTLSPEEPRTNDSLVAGKAGWSDPDGDAESYRYTWTVDGAPVGGQTGPILDGEHFVKGQTVQVRVVPFDGTDEGEALTGAALVVNTPPGAPDLYLAPSAPVAGVDPLVCTITEAAEDADGDALTYVFRWEVDGLDYPAQVSGSLGPGTTTHPGDTVPPGDTQPGQEWICYAAAHDGEEPGPESMVSSNPNYDQVQDFSLVDVNSTSPTHGQAVSPRDYLQKVSGWYFGHST